LPQSLDELVTKPGDCPNWQEGGYLKGKSTRDPWGHEYNYNAKSGDFEIICLGADGKQGGSGTDRDLSSKNLDEAAK
jgi:general secretion pathway protein G